MGALIDKLRQWFARVPWALLRQRRTWLVIALATALIVPGWLSTPPPLPSHAQLRAGWQPSEAWLYDRNGQLLDQIRVDYVVRRLGWTPLEAVSPAMREAVVAAEDRRFYAHGGVDWLALGGVMRDRLSGRRALGASTPCP